MFIIDTFKLISNLSFEIVGGTCFIIYKLISGPSGAATAPKLKHKKPKHFTVVEDELSTILGSTVSVAPDGTVHIKKSKDKR